MVEFPPLFSNALLRAAEIQDDWSIYKEMLASTKVSTADTSAQSVEASHPDTQAHLVDCLVDD